MRPLRAIIPLVRRQPSAALVREAVWRVWKPYRSVRLQAAIRRGETRIAFRNLPYYKPDLSRIDAQSAETILSFADLICGGRFAFMGYPTASLGFPPPWNRDFVSGFEWEQLPASQMHPVVRHNGSDVKVPWELSRLQFLPVLAKAWRLSGKGHYREVAKDLLSDWLEKNPVGTGVNWTLAMETALRGMSLCFTLSLLQPLQPGEEMWERQVTRSVWEHLLYTESCLEFSHLVRSNHYLGNITGLLCMTMFLQGPGMARRRNQYLTQIQKEILRQVYEDGGDYEASFSYHVLVLQMFTSAFLLMRAEGVPIEQEFIVRLQKMYEYLAEIAGPCGYLPHVGDTDDGRVELLTSDLKQIITQPPDQRNSLLVSGMIGIGNGLFDLGYQGSFEDAAWYGLPAAKSKSNDSRQIVFPKSGVGVARSGTAEVIFCAIPNGIHGGGSHSHNDKLSLILRLGGQELFCDAGTFCYTRDAAKRNQFRSTRAHNTIMVDGEEQNLINPDKHYVFCIGNEAVVSAIEVKQNGAKIQMSASHSGYRRLGVEHKRSVTLCDGLLLVEDELAGSNEHSFEMNWNIPSPWRIAPVSGEEIVIAGPMRVHLQVSSTLPLECSEQPAQISRTYGGAIQPGTTVRIAGRGRFPCFIVTKVQWDERHEDTEYKYRAEKQVRC